MERNGINCLIIYTVFDIMKTVIEFLRDEHGTQPTLTLIRQLIKDAATSTDAYQLLQFVERGLEFIEYHGIPANPPLMEFRVNWEEPDAGAFRAVFFEYHAISNFSFCTRGNLATNDFCCF